MASVCVARLSYDPQAPNLPSTPQAIRRLHAATTRQATESNRDADARIVELSRQAQSNRQGSRGEKNAECLEVALNILAIDPGNVESAYMILRDGGICVFAKVENDSILKMLEDMAGNQSPCELVIEQIACMGMAVGESVFETVFWSGRFAQIWKTWGYQYLRQFHRIKRGEVKMHLCGTMRAKDANIRQALIDRFGAPGTKKNPGATYGISGDVWAALAVAVTFYDRQTNG